MSGWIKVEKDLANDPRVLRMASRMRNADVTLGSRSRLVVVGALVTLWWYADTHIREDDTLPIGADQIDELVGIEGFCDLMPDEWFQIIDSDSVKLVDYTTHNGTTAKKRALGQKRQERHRNANSSVTLASRSHNPNSVTRPREDLDKTKKEERDARAPADVPRGTVIEAGNRLTQLSAASAFGSLLEDWRNDVPECNPMAFAKWIVHVESSGKQMNPAMRLAQAKRLAGNGSFPEQAEVVDFCIEQGWKSLVPLADVRARTQGMARGSKQTKPVQSDDQRLEKLKANRAACVWLEGFRDPNPGETADQYLKAQEDQFKIWQRTQGAPRFPDKRTA